MEDRVRESCWYKNVFLISRALFWWTVPFFKAGYKKTFKLDELRHVPRGGDCETAWKRLDRLWEAELRSSKTVNFRHVAARAFSCELIFPGILMILTDSLLFAQPYLINEMLLFFDGNSTRPRRQAIVYVMCLVCSMMFYALAQPHTYFQSNTVSLKIKAAVTALIYRKILRLNSKSSQQTHSGFIINLIATDVEKCEDAWRFLPLCLFPVWTALTVCLMLREFGTLCLFGVAAYLTILGINILNAKIYGNLRTVIAEWGDSRIKTIKEILDGMRLVKMACWENPLTAVVQNLRRNEVKHLTQAAVLRSVNLSLSVTSGRLAMFAIFTGGWWIGLCPPVSSVIIAIGVLEVYQIRCRMAVSGLEDWLQLTRSFRRIQEFLMLPEQDATRILNIPTSSGSSVTPGDVVIGHIYAGWRIFEDVTARRLEDEAISLLTSSDTQGECIAVTGDVGSGKSSLLLAILGELPICKGKVQVCGDVAYLQQHPWIFHGTIRQNIIMSEEFAEHRYDQVIYACALTTDLELMPHGDQTLVGDRGLMLSGGQKSRITLARAIYKKSSIYLLDDPLSAVDPNVGKHIFQHCICGFLAGKTIILVTHQLQYLRAVDRIVLMKAGRTIGVGSFHQLEAQSKLDLANFMLRHVKRSHMKEDVKQTAAERTTYCTEGREDDGFDEEHNEEGGTSRRVYLEYLKAGNGYIMCPLFFLLAFLATISLVLGDVYLLKWTKGHTQFVSNKSIGNNNIAESITQNESKSEGRLLCYESQTTPNQMLMHYTMYSACMVFVFPLSCVTIALFVSYASRNLHQRVFSAVLAAKMRFFDCQPRGRVLNRFSRDMGFVDTALLLNIWTCGTKGVMLVVFLGLVCYTNYWLTLALAPFLLCLYIVSHVAIRTTRQFKRLEAAARSPVFSFITDTITGLPTIRSMTLCNDYINKFNDLQDSHSSALFMVYATDWGYTMVCLLTFWVYFSIVVSSFTFMELGVSRDLLSLSMIYLMSGAFNFLILTRVLCSTEIQMTSVERILAYTKLTPELAESPAVPPPTTWPSRGDIILRDVNLKYHDDAPLVLKNINLSIQGKEKIGIVGRTGAGKSSLINLLLRLAEHTGEIWIDNIDVTKIGLHELREKISVIPQDPILFSGSLRCNLDMFNETADREIWEVLHEVKMKEVVDRLPGRLYAEITEGANNFSVGERQLLCLARTILRHNKILILDEASANVDYRTDNIIQETIRRRFADCTVLTVAHRQQTVMGSDRILVLDGGEVQEFDKPKILLEKEDGYFKRFVEQSGLSVDPLLNDY